MNEGGLSRRAMFLKIGIAFNGLVGAALAVPIVRYILSPITRGQKPGYEKWLSLGSIDQFPSGQTRLATYRNPVANPWDGETALGITGLNANMTAAADAVAYPYSVLRKNAEFRLRFADHVYKRFFNGGVYYVNPASPNWDVNRPTNNVPAARFYQITEQIRGPMVAESARWGDQKGTRGGNGKAYIG